MTSSFFPSISVSQMIEVDRLMIEEYGITLLQMMENAGRGLGTLARHLLGSNAAGRDEARTVVGDLYLADISVPAGVYRAVGVDPTTLFARGPLVRVRSVGTGWQPEPFEEVA